MDSDPIGSTTLGKTSFENSAIAVVGLPAATLLIVLPYPRSSFIGFMWPQVFFSHHCLLSCMVFWSITCFKHPNFMWKCICQLTRGCYNFHKCFNDKYIHIFCQQYCLNLNPQCHKTIFVKNSTCFFYSSIWILSWIMMCFQSWTRPMKKQAYVRVLQKNA